MTSDDQTHTYPLTSLQTSMVLSSLRAPQSGAYIVQDVCERVESVNIPLLQRAWRIVEQRHTALRTRIETGTDGKLWQRVMEDSEISWQVLDWTRVAPREEQKELAAFLRRDCQRGFHFDQGVPARFTLLQHSDRSYTLVCTIHHALLDGRSLLLLWRECFTLYDGFLRGEEVRLAEPRPFHEHLDWLHQQDLTKAERYWRENLAGLLQTTDFVVDRLRPASTQYGEDFAKETVSVSGELTQQLSDFAFRHHITLNNLVQGAWALLLSRYSGRPDVVFGVTRAGRHSSVAGAEEMAGVLVNTLPFRIAVLPDTPLLLWLRQIRKQSMVMREYEHNPLDKVWGWSGLPPGTPPFDNLLAYEHAPPAETLRELGGNGLPRTFTRFQRTDSSLTLVAYGRPRLILEIVYALRKFGRETIAGMLDHMQSLLRSFVAQPDDRLGALPMLTESERQWLVQERNRTEADYPVDLCAHQLCERQVQRVPARAALEYLGGSISYDEMNRRANQLARLLLARNIEREDIIAVCVKRSPEAVIAALAVLKAGAAFMSLDPGVPFGRLVGSPGTELEFAL